MRLKKIFEPTSVAIIGATERSNSVGRVLFQNILSGGYSGNIYPVNLKHRKVFDHKCYAYLSRLPEVPDLVVIATPRGSVPSLVEQAGKLGVGGVLILTAGFKEAGRTGKKLQKEILKLANKYDLPIIGPNCLGLIHPKVGLNVTFASRMARKGRIAFISQSGALCSSILDWADDEQIGFSYFVSVGDMLNVDYADLIDYLGMDSRTTSILIYMESLHNARKFMSAARAFARRKPIIVLKSGRSEEGAIATQSHTGALAGNDAAFDAAFQRAGIVRVQSVGELFDCARALATQSRPKDNKLMILSNAGGPGVLATDRLIQQGGKLAHLSKKITKALDTALPPHCNKNNPIDLRGDASAEVFKNALEIIAQEDHADGILIIFAPQGVTDSKAVAKEVVVINKKYRKPILAVMMGEQDVKEGREILEKGGVPVYRYPESAVDVFLYMWRYARNLELLHATPPSIPKRFVPNRELARTIINQAIENQRSSLSEAEAKQLLAAYDISILESRLATSASGAKRIAAEIGFPVAMKIEGYAIPHKTEYGGIRLNVRNQQEAIRTFNDIVENIRTNCPEAIIQGVSISPMISYMHELIIGARKDPVFGPIILFGMGGIAVEVFKDQQIGLPPLNMALALRIMERTKIYQLLKGFRSLDGVDLKSIQFTLYKFAYLVMDFPELASIEVNPFVVDQKGGIVLDAKAQLEPRAKTRLTSNYSHLAISPYPEQYTKTIQLKNGQSVLLRPIRPEDEPLEKEMFNLLSKETVYYRFFGYIPKLTHDLLIRFTHIDYDREMAIVAELNDNNKRQLIGVVRIVGDAWRQKAEYAIVVADPWHGQGLGSQLTSYILEIAKKMGFESIFATTLKSNEGMLKVFKKFGFEIKSEDFETNHAELKL